MADDQGYPSGGTGESSLFSYNPYDYMQNIINPGSPYQTYMPPSPVGQSLQSMYPQQSGSQFAPSPGPSSGFGNQGFFVPSGNQTQVPQNVQMPTGQMSSTGFQGPAGAYGQPQNTQVPSNMSQDYFSKLYAPSYLSGQQYTQQQSSVANALQKLPEVMKSFGLPTDATGTSKFADQVASMASYPLMQQEQSAEREVEEDAARRGASLSSDRDTRLGEIRGASASAMRQSSVGAALDYYMKLMSSIPGMVKGLQ